MEKCASGKFFLVKNAKNGKNKAQLSGFWRVLVVFGGFLRECTDLGEARKRIVAGNSVAPPGLR
jgi:hypothetical protein